MSERLIDESNLERMMKLCKEHLRDAADSIQYCSGYSDGIQFAISCFIRNDENDEVEDAQSD